MQVAIGVIFIIVGVIVLAISQRESSPTLQEQFDSLMKINKEQAGCIEMQQTTVRNQDDALKRVTKALDNAMETVRILGEANDGLREHLAGREKP